MCKSSCLSMLFSMGIFYFPHIRTNNLCENQNIQLLKLSESFATKEYCFNNMSELIWFEEYCTNYLSERIWHEEFYIWHKEFCINYLLEVFWSEEFYKKF